MLAMEKIARLEDVMFILGVLIHDYIKIDYTVFWTCVYWFVLLYILILASGEISMNLPW